jgi:hypothetical protein
MCIQTGSHNIHNISDRPGLTEITENKTIFCEESALPCSGQHGLCHTGLPDARRTGDRDEWATLVEQIHDPIKLTLSSQERRSTTVIAIALH